MGNLQGFDATQHETMMSFEALPDGLYTAIATESEFKDTLSGNGQYLQITWQIVDGDYTGRLLWSRLNLQNPSEKAVEIAQRELATICKAAGKLKPSDSSELHNIPIVLDVYTEEYKDKPQNRIRNYFEATNAARAPKADKKAAGNGSLPWQKK